MDKKKVIEQIENAIYQLDPFSMDGSNYDDLCKNATKMLENALQELSKSDWISVEDELPPYGEEVLVYSKGRQFLPHTAMRMKTNDYHFDNNGFLKAFHVTHWCKIDKLEV